jgi:hypothetical protein
MFLKRTIFSAFICLILLGRAEAGNVAYSKRYVRGVPVHIVTANLNSPSVRVTPSLAIRGVGTSEGFGSMLSRLQPTAAITGTYFCTRSLIPVGDIVINGKPVHDGPVGTALAITNENKAEFKPRTSDWKGYNSVICSGPRIVSNGTPSLNPRAEGFSDPSLFRSALRSAVGVTAGNKLLLVTTSRPATMRKVAYIMADLGAVDAILLDGGSSTALSYKGSVKRHPARRLTNLLLVYDSSETFERVAERLAPEVAKAGE